MPEVQLENPTAAPSPSPSTSGHRSTRVEIDRLAKHFPARKGLGERVTKAVDDVVLEIEPGELFFLLGPSGCGKTTLLRMIAGFIEPTNGRILFDGRDVAPLSPNKRNTGMVFQSYALWPHMTVEANVAYGLKVRKIPTNERRDRVREALNAVQMAAYAKRKPAQLSGGQQQRVALARALVVRPSVLLLDEPLSNLDAKLRLELRHEIRRVCKESGLTTIYVTHDQKEALSMADRVAILKDGKVVQVGPPAVCYRQPADHFVAEFLGETNFVDATVREASKTEATLVTAAGPLHARLHEDRPPLDAGDHVTLSLRPETMRLVDHTAPQALRATRVGRTHLGEIAQHQLRLETNESRAEGQLVLAAELNPAASFEEGERVGIHIDPNDVVVLPPATNQGVAAPAR
ncbi:MAG: ABC transporter ATP-binding protein [Planctomycetota bacterium]